MRGWMRRGVVRIGGVLGDSSLDVDLFGGRARTSSISVDALSGDIVGLVVVLSCCFFLGIPWRIH